MVAKFVSLLPAQLASCMILGKLLDPVESFFPPLYVGIVTAHAFQGLYEDYMRWYS